jgi:hypothetical protein
VSRDADCFRLVLEPMIAAAGPILLARDAVELLARQRAWNRSLTGRDAA